MSTKFTIRVELHEATSQNYDDMASDLARHDVTDEIASSDGTVYKMSPGEYTYEGNKSIDDVLNTVRAAADRTGRANAVFVTEAVRRTWIGLQAARSRRIA